MRQNEVSAKVKARNRVNQETLNLVPVITAALQNFVGQKISLATGGFSKKFKDGMPTLPNLSSLSAHFECSYNSLKLRIKTCEMLENGCSCTYAENVVYVGEVDNSGILTKVLYINAEYYPTNYTVEMVNDIEKQLRDAQSLVSSLQSKLYAITQ